MKSVCQLRLAAVPVAMALAVGLGSLAACGGDDTSEAGGATTNIAVSSTEDACTLSAEQAPAGQLVFAVKNDGSAATEFYLYDAAGEKVVAEVENIGPGLTRNLEVSVKAGTYTTGCKPGMAGDGIRAPFIVAAASASPVTTG